MGDRALLLELYDNESVHAAAALARRLYAESLQDAVPGHSTLLVVWREGLDPDPATVAAELSSARNAREAAPELPETLVTIPVRYDGPDLEEVAAALGVSVAQVVEIHTAVLYTVAFMGFAPGFPYLIAAAEQGGESSRGSAGRAERPLEVPQHQVRRLLELPRRATPRTAVAAGSVAVAAGYCGIYPRSSPGGWNLLGHTDLIMFDPDRQPPALLAPGARVRFEAE